MHHDSVIEIFSAVWWKGLLLSITAIIAFIWAARVSNEKNKTRISVLIGVLLISVTLFLPVYQVSRHEFNVQNSLPLNLCSLSGILSGIVLLWRNQAAYEVLLYWGIAGAFYSLITPEPSLGTEGWYLYDYYIAHAGIILSCLFLTLINGMTPRPLSWLKVFAFTQILALIVGIIDKLIQANYMFLVQKPAVANPFVIGIWPWYIISLEVAALLHFFVIYLVFKKGKYRKEDSLNVLAT